MIVSRRPLLLDVDVVGAALCASCVVGTLVLLLGPIRTSWQRALHAEQELLRRGIQATSELAELNRTELTVRDLQKLCAEYAEHAPTSERLLEELAAFYALCDQHQVHVRSSKPGPVEDHGHFSSASIEISADGESIRLLEVLQTLARRSANWSISRLRIVGPATGRQCSLEWTLRLRMQPIRPAGSRS